jgi:hypothetical protein
MTNFVQISGIIYRSRAEISFMCPQKGISGGIPETSTLSKVPEVYHSAIYSATVLMAEIIPYATESFFLAHGDSSTVSTYHGYILSRLADVDEAKTFRIVEAMLIQRHDVGKTEYIVFNVQINYSFERVWSDMSPWDLVVNLDSVYLDKHNHLLATFTFPWNGKPLHVYQVVILALIIQHDADADPRPLWDPYHYRYSRLLMNLLEEEHKLEVQAVPLHSYQNGIDAYTIYNRVPKNVLQIVLDEYHVEEAHFERDVCFSFPSSVYLPIINDLI